MMQEKIKTPLVPTRQLYLLTGLVLVFTVGYMVGSVVPWQNEAPKQYPVIHAMTSQAYDSFAVCTVPISNGLDGFFILDFLTGDLSGGVINPMTSKFSATFRHSVLNDLGFQPDRDKNPKFLLVAGQAEKLRNPSARLAPAALYVTNCASGVTVAYGIPLANQIGARLVPLDVAKPRGDESE